MDSAFPCKGNLYISNMFGLFIYSYLIEPDVHVQPIHYLRFIGDTI